LEKKQEEKGSINLLSDQPLSGDNEQDIRFGHDSMADSLAKIILQCPIPFTVGLFGRWGSGKTTIINILQKKTKGKELALIKFDVWKHERDSLRRTFLEDLAKQARNLAFLKSDFKLSPRLKNPIEKTVTRDFDLDWKILLFFFLAGILGLIIYRFWGFQVFGLYFSLASGSTFFSALFILALKQSTTKESLTITEEPFKDPREFEDEFDRIVNTISAKRILIVIDNLDRCSHNKAVELLSTIKTFLAKDLSDDKANKCIFLIACDDEAIKRHLQSVYGVTYKQDAINAEEPFSADEFLRKFFNAYMRVPEFIDTELQTYTEALLKEANIPQFTSSMDIAFVITNAFRENPRQIKQFINSLIVHFLVAQERENRDSPLIIPKETITGNVAFLAKFLIIQQKFPTEYIEIRRKNSTIKEMEKLNNPKLREFLHATKTISVQDIRPFIYLKRSIEELSIPDIESIVLGLIDNTPVVVKEKIKGIKDNAEKIKGLQRYILSLVVRNDGKKQLLFNITSCLLESFHALGMQMSQELNDAVADFLNNESIIGDELHSIDPSLIFEEVLVKCNKEDKNGIISTYLSGLGRQDDKYLTPEHAYDVINELLKHEEWLENNFSAITGHLENIHYSSLKVLSLFEDRIDLQQRYISKTVINKLIGQISFTDIQMKQDINNKINTIIKFQSVMNSNNSENIILKLDALLKEENQQGYRVEKKNFTDCIDKILETLKPQLTAMSSKNSLNAFSETVVKGASILTDWNQKPIFASICLKMFDLLGEGPQKLSIDSTIKGIFTNTTVDNIKNILDKTSKDNIEVQIERYNAIFQKRALQQQPVFDFLYPIAPKSIRIQWFDLLITSQLQRALMKLEELKYKVDDPKKVVEKLLQDVTALAVEDKLKVYNVVNSMRVADDVDLKNVFALQIKGLLKNIDKTQQEVGYNALLGAKQFSAPLKREIARDIIEWLRTLDPAKAGQAYAINSVLINWKDLEPIVCGEYQDFVFDKLITKGANIDNIRLGFDILAKIKPKYKGSEKYFDNVLAKVSAEPDVKIKSELLDRLISIPKTKSQEFSEKIMKIRNEEKPTTE
jgi:hypothetical protein